VVVGDVVDVEPEVELAAIQDRQRVTRRKVRRDIGFYLEIVVRRVLAVLLADVLRQQRRRDAVAVEDGSNGGGALGGGGEPGVRELVVRVVQGRVAVY